MSDISAQLMAIAPVKRDRMSSASSHLLEGVTAAVGGRINWDSGAGEDWATVMVGEQTSVQVYMQGSLVLTPRPHLPAIRAAVGPSAIIVDVSDMDVAELSASREALAAAFDLHLNGTHGELNPDSFSANDLWFWTI